MTKRVRKVRLRILAALGSAWIVLACNSPFIPIPPPTPSFEPVEVPDETGGGRMQWRASSPPDYRMGTARVSLYNRQMGVGIIVKANVDGSYVAFPVPGQEGDFIDIYWERSDSERSLTICQVLSRTSRVCP